MKKNLLLPVGILGFFVVLLFLFPAAHRHAQSSQMVSPEAVEMEPLSIQRTNGKRHDFKVEVARTPTAHARGLMFRKEMPADSGMLFLFKGEAERSFWMRNTLIPLDMIFIKADGTILKIHENAIPHDLTEIPSGGPVMAVLEINGGRSKALGFKAGDTVRHAAFANILAD